MSIFARFVWEGWREGFVVQHHIHQDTISSFGLLDHRANGGDPLMINYRACDIDESCREVLKDFGGVFAPEHIHGDILDRVDDDTKSALETLLLEHQALRNQQMNEQHSDGPAPPKLINMLTKQSGRQLMKAAFDLIRSRGDGIWKSTAQCFRCNAQCCIHPPPAIRGNRLYMNVGGNTCTPWSSVNQSSMMWLTSHSLVVIVWLADLMLHDPAFLIQECTRLFDVVGFKMIVQDMFYVQNAVFSPTDLGIPSHRQRSYCLRTNKKDIVVRIPFELSCLREHFFRRLDADARIYFRAPTSLQKVRLLELQRLRQIEPSSSQGEELNFRDLLAAGDRTRLDCYEVASKELDLPFVCVNITQNVGTVSTMDGSCPALLRRSVVWGLQLDSGRPSNCPVPEEQRVDRLLLWYESLAAQGIPVLLRSTDDMTRYVPNCFSFRRALYGLKGSLTGDVVASMAGNGMHVSQIGLLLVFCMFSVDLHTDTASDCASDLSDDLVNDSVPDGIALL